MRTQKVKRLKWYYAIFMGLTEIISGLLTAITIGYVSPSWTLRLAMYASNKDWFIMEDCEV